jgi:hypothetical protein
MGFVLAAGDQAARLGGDVFHGGEPDFALLLHVFDQLRHRAQPRRPAGDEGMPDADPQAAMVPGRIELLAETGHRFGRGANRHFVVDVGHVDIRWPVIQAPMARQLHQIAAL